MTDPFWYPSVEDVLHIHEDIVSEYANTSPGIHSRGDVEFALEYVSEGSFGSVSETIHEKAFHLLRLLVANHPFVDGNKRTAPERLTGPVDKKLSWRPKRRRANAPRSTT